MPALGPRSATRAGNLRTARAKSSPNRKAGKVAHVPGDSSARTNVSVSSGAWPASAASREIGRPSARKCRAAAGWPAGGVTPSSAAQDSPPRSRRLSSVNQPPGHYPARMTAPRTQTKPSLSRRQAARAMPVLTPGIHCSAGDALDEAQSSSAGRPRPGNRVAIRQAETGAS